jgi:hypothetical protein
MANCEFAGEAWITWERFKLYSPASSLAAFELAMSNYKTE